MRYFVAIALMLFLACSGPSGDFPQDSNEPIKTAYCLSWQDWADYYRINIAGDEIEIDENHFYLEDMEPGIYSAYIRDVGGEMIVRFLIEFSEDGEPLIFER